MADDRKLSRIVMRILLLLLVAAGLHALLRNYLSGDTAQLGRLLLVAAMVLIARLYVAPALFLQSPKPSPPTSAGEGSCAETSNAVAGRGRRRL